MDEPSMRERILTAATSEFAAHGRAGARVDRIAARALANKERIYAYFGDKQQLFDIVLREAIIRSEAWTSSSSEDLAVVAGDLFDTSLDSSDVVNLLAWHRLEPSGASPGEEDITPYRQKIAAIRAAQAAGNVDPHLDPTDLLALLGALATAWSAAEEPLKVIAEATGLPIRGRRQVIEDAMRRIMSPTPTHPPQPSSNGSAPATADSDDHAAIPTQT